MEKEINVCSEKDNEIAILLRLDDEFFVHFVQTHAELYQI